MCKLRDHTSKNMFTSSLKSFLLPHPERICVYMSKERIPVYMHNKEANSNESIRECYDKLIFRKLERSMNVTMSVWHFPSMSPKHGENNNIKVCCIFFCQFLKVFLVFLLIFLHLQWNFFSIREKNWETKSTEKSSSCAMPDIY